MEQFSVGSATVCAGFQSWHVFLGLSNSEMCIQGEKSGQRAFKILPDARDIAASILKIFDSPLTTFFDASELEFKNA